MRPRNSEADGFDDRGYVALWRPGLDLGQGGAAQFLKARGIGECFSYQFSKGLDVTTAKNEIRATGGDEVSRGSAAVAGRGDAAAAHGLVDNDAEGLKLRGQNQQVPGGVDGGGLRLVDEPQTTYSGSNAKARSFGLEMGKKGARAGVNEERVREIGFRECTEKIERTLPLLEFGGEHNDNIIRGNAPRRANGRALDHCRLPHPPAVINAVRRKSHPAGTNAQQKNHVARAPRGTNHLIGHA